MRGLLLALLLGVLLIGGCTQNVPSSPQVAPVHAPANASAPPAVNVSGTVPPAGNGSGLLPPGSQIVGNDSDAHGCKGSAGYTWCGVKQECIRPWETPCEGAITIVAAEKIAQNSSCMATGNLTGSYTYNNFTGTWWFDLDTAKAGCAPACVVYEANLTAGVNWRCTGAMNPLSFGYTVNTANLSGAGQILTDGNGFTLYVFTNDAVNQSTCSGTCATIWPPVLISNDQITIPSGLPGTVGAIIRQDGTMQMTYNGMPLYRYSADSLPGQANGQGFGGKWFVAQTNLTRSP